MHAMKVRYLKLPDVIDPSGYTWFPYLQVCLRSGNKSRVVHALVDSGAVDCIFPESTGRLLGIDVPSGTSKTYYGIARQPVNGYLHSVDLRVTGLDQWITILAGFVDADIDPLLGQRGFFEKYQISFERWRYQFEINKKETALMKGRRGR